MKVNEELATAIENVRYYGNEVVRLAKEQFKTDCDGHVAGDDTLTKRVDFLGLIGELGGDVSFKADCMANALKSALALTKQLAPIPEEETPF